MSRVVEQGRCEYCGSSDAGTRYEDGSYFCFSCRTSEKGSEVIKYRHRNDDRPLDKIELPHDTVGYIPQIALDWLKPYELTKGELTNFRWSSYQEMLIYPIYVNNHLVFWQGRYFPKRTPKTYNKGVLRHFPHVVVPQVPSRRLIVVEDVVSALKVGRYYPCLCMFGSSIQTEWIPYMRKHYDHLSLWMDHDKRKTTVAVKSRLSLLFQKVDVIITEEDPKEYTNEELVRWLK